jgi:hypothetical protein
MSKRSSAAALGHEFDDFLFATIGAEHVGVQTTVVSMLGRMNLDPWQAAADFAGRPVKAATLKLAAMILGAPGGSLESGEADATAARLIMLLPRKTVAPHHWSAALPAAGSLPLSKARLWAVGVAVIVTFVLCAQFFMAN